MLFLRSVFFAALIPGTVTGVIPYLMVSHGAGAPQSLNWFAVLPVAAGAAILFRCIWDFAATGRGTLAPVDPPTRLVVRGLYRYVRNPMYVGVVLSLLGEAMLFASVPLLIHAAVTLVIVHLFVVFYEEPTLRRMFGEPYEEYTRTVHRWLPRKPRKAAA